jgi:hypothetical protein
MICVFNFQRSAKDSMESSIDPFTELGMGEGVFMGALEIFLKIFFGG